MKKRHAGFARHGARQERLAGSRRAHEKHPFGNPRADIQEFFRIFQEIHYLFQFFFGFFHSGHVFEGNSLVFVIWVNDSGFGLAERKSLHARSLNLPGNKPEDDNEKYNRQSKRQNIQEPETEAAFVFYFNRH